MSGINFQPTIIVQLGANSSQHRVVVSAPSKGAPFTIKSGDGTTNGRVFAPQVGEDQWDAERVALLTAHLNAALPEILNNVDLSKSGAADRVNMLLRAKAQTYMETTLFDDSVDDLQRIGDTAMTEIAKLSKQNNPPKRGPGYPVDPVDPEEPIFEEGETMVTLMSALSARFLQPNGTLFSGTGIPGSKYNIVSNDLLEIGLTAHRRSKWDEGRTWDEADIHIDLATTVPADRWNVSWSIGLKNDDVELITDLFDIEFIMGLRNDGTMAEGECIVYQLEYNPDAVAPNSPYSFTETTGIINSIVDSRSDAELRCVQNSSSLHWVKASLLPPLAADAPVEGIYGAQIRATNKQTGTVLTNTLIVSAMV